MDFPPKISQRHDGQHRVNVLMRDPPTRVKMLRQNVLRIGHPMGLSLPDSLERSSLRCQRLDREGQFGPFFIEISPSRILVMSERDAQKLPHIKDRLTQQELERFA